MSLMKPYKPASHHEIDSLSKLKVRQDNPNHMCALSIDVALPSYKILPSFYGRALPTSLHTLASTFLDDDHLHFTVLLHFHAMADGREF